MIKGIHMSGLKLLIVSGLSLLLLSIAGCGGGSGSSSGSTPPSPSPTPPSSQTLDEKYGSLVLSENISLGGSSISGAVKTLSYYPSSTSAKSVIKNPLKSHNFIVYNDVLQNHKTFKTADSKKDGVGISSPLPTYDPKIYGSYAIESKGDDSYGLASDDNLVLITISGGTIDGSQFLGKLYSLIPESYLAGGQKPMISELGTFAVITVMSSNPATKDDALSSLQELAENYFSANPSDGGEVSFNSFNSFNPKDTSVIKDITSYQAVVENSDFINAIKTGDDAWIQENVLDNDKDKDGVIAAIGSCSDENYQNDGYKGRDCFDNRAEIYKYLPTDKDGDFIPDDVEVYLGMNPNSWDQNDNGIADGIDSSFDTFYKNQWHLRSTGLLTNNINDIKTIVGNDLDILEVQRSYMGYNGGKFIGVQIVDSGVEANHEDIKPNIDLNLSRNAMYEQDTSLNPNDPTPTETVDDTEESGAPMSVGHGSACAGIIAARGLNSKGVRGGTPLAKISGSNWLEYQSLSNLSDIWLVPDMSDMNITLSNNSWGSKKGNYDYDTIVSYDALLDKGAELRNGKGRVYLFAAGNDRMEDRDANLDGPASHRYSITVAALDYNNSYAPYSSPGANIWLSGYAGSWYNQTPTIATTLLTGKSKVYGASGWNEYSAPTFEDDSSRSYTYGFNGTSAATPTVSSVLALVLEACPELTQRELKYLSATTAKKIDTTNSSWVTNKAGYKYSRDYGFGLVNPSEIIEECKGKSGILGAEQNLSITKGDVNISIPPNSTHTEEFSADKDMKIEYIYVWHDLDTTQTGSRYAEMSLISPSGTTMPIMVNLDDPDVDFTGGMRFGVAGFLDESSSGVWKLLITNSDPYSSMSVDNFRFEIFGR